MAEIHCIVIRAHRGHSRRFITRIKQDVESRDKPGHDESGGETAAVIASASAQRPSCPRMRSIQHAAAIRFISDVAGYWVVRWSLSSGAHSRDPVAHDDGSAFSRRHNLATSRHVAPELCQMSFAPH
jgi:hypothetical protein